MECLSRDIMSSSRDNRRENRDVTRSLADKDGQVQALQERILKMEEEIARKDIAITSLSGVKSLLEKSLQRCAGELKEASDEVHSLLFLSLLII